MLSEQMPLPVVPGTEQEPLPVASEQMPLPLPTSPEMEQEPLLVALDEMPSQAVPGIKHEASHTALEQILLPTCDGFELSPWRLYGNPYGSTECLIEKCPLEPSPVVSA